MHKVTETDMACGAQSFHRGNNEMNSVIIVSTCTAYDNLKTGLMIRYQIQRWVHSII